MMTTIALRGVRSHPVRFVLSVLAVLLGVGFVAGTFSLRTMMASTFDELIDSTVTADAYLRGAELAGTPGFTESGIADPRGPIPLTTAEAVRDVAGVRLALPTAEGPVVLVGADGTAVLTSQAPSFGMPLHPQDPAAEVVAGRAPAGPDEVALEAGTFAASGLDLGDRTTLVVDGAIQEVTVVGEVDLGGSMVGATIVLLDPATALAAFAPDGLVPSVAVHAEPGVAEDVLAARLAEVLAGTGALPGTGAAPGTGAPSVSGAPSGPEARPGPVVEVATGAQMRAEATEQITEALGFVETFLLVFAAISLFVGAFIIANTFTMSVRQRQRELALLRALGASPAQVFRSVLGQAAVVGLIGSVLGVGAGLGLVAVLRSVLGGMGMELSGSIPLEVSTVAVALLTGVVVSVLAAILPARRAALVPPVEAMRDDVVTRDRSLVLRGSVGALVTGAGAALVVLATRSDDGGALLGAGALAVLVGVLVLAPALARSVVGVLGAPFVALAAPLGRLARGNVTRNPRRTAATAGALMIGMALVGAASVLAASTQESMRAVVAQEVGADLVVQSAIGTVPEGAVSAIERVDGVARADAVTAGRVAIEGEQTFVAGYPGEGLGGTFDVTVVAGDLAAVADGGLAVQRTVADDRGWQLGDVLALGAAGKVRVPIGAIVDSQALGAPVLLAADRYAEVVPPGQSAVYTVFVAGEAGTDTARLQDAVVAAISPFVVLSALDTEEFTSELAAQVDQMLVVVYALLGLSVVIAVLGIINTLALSVIERTREIGLLRAVGLGRLQLAGTVTIESVLTAVFGTVLGLAVGVGLASALPSVLADVGLRDLVVPWTELGGVLVLAVTVGMVAAVWPAVRAARLPVLEAISRD